MLPATRGQRVACQASAFHPNREERKGDVISQHIPTLAQYARMIREDMAEGATHGTRARLLVTHPDASFEDEWLAYMTALILAGADISPSNRRLLTSTQLTAIEVAEWQRANR